VTETNETGLHDRTKEAFRELVDAEMGGCTRSRRLVRDGAEDLVQEALLQAYRSFGGLREDAAAGRWLKTILVNVFRDQLRKRSRSVDEVTTDSLEDFSLYRTLVDQDPLPYSDTLHADFLAAFGREDLREVLMRLPEIYRVALVVRTWTGSPPRRSRACWTRLSGRSSLGCTEGEHSSRRSCGPTRRTPDSSSKGDDMTETERAIPCSEAVRQLWDYLDHSIGPEDQEKVEKHLAFCRKCCGELEFAKEIRAFLASGAVTEIPPNVKARLERFVEDL
jgi:anti-sigma factor (TIGR02949 family)